jgi:hypothetical protein
MYVSLSYEAIDIFIDSCGLTSKKIFTSRTAARQVKIGKRLTAALR